MWGTQLHLRRYFTRAGLGNITNSRSYRLIALGVLLLAQAGLTRGQWSVIPFPTTNPITDVGFSDSLRGWAIGYDGIFASQDGGMNWTLEAPFHARWLAVINAKNIWATGPHGATGDTILHSLDGGIQWQTIRFDTLPDGSQITDFGQICFVDSSRGWFLAGNYDGRTWIFRTTDGGNHWSPLQFSSPFLLFCSFVDSSYGLTTGINSYVFRTTDGGLSWDSTEINAYSNKTDLQFIDRRVGWFANDGPVQSTVAYKSVDSGTTWTNTKEFSCSDLTTCLFFADTLEGWIAEYDCYYGGELLVTHTTDGGATWNAQLQYSPTSFFRPRRMFFLDKLHGWIVGDRGLIFLTTNGGVTDVKSGDPAAAPTFSLTQNYPNPFNPSTTIEYELPAQSHVEIRVFDVLGRQVSTLVKEEKPAGKYSVQWNAADMPSGIYFYRMELHPSGPGGDAARPTSGRGQTGGIAATKKLLLLR